MLNIVFKEQSVAMSDDIAIKKAEINEYDFLDLYSHFFKVNLRKS
jgi:hypothetical protein